MLATLIVLATLNIMLSAGLVWVVSNIRDDQQLLLWIARKLRAKHGENWP